MTEGLIVALTAWAIGAYPTHFVDVMIYVVTSEIKIMGAYERKLGQAEIYPGLYMHAV